MLQLSATPDDFVPQTELERAYIQSTGLIVRRLYDRARQSKDRHDWAAAAGQSAALVRKCVLQQREDRLIVALEILNCVIEKLTEHQRFSLFKCFAHVVQTLFDEGFELNDKHVSVILYLMLRLFFCAGELRGAEIVCMMRLLNEIYNGPQWLPAFAFLAGESGYPAAPIGMLNDSLTAGQREFFGHSPFSGHSLDSLSGAPVPTVRATPMPDFPVSARLPAFMSDQDREYLVTLSFEKKSEMTSAKLDLISTFHQELVEAIRQHGFRSPQTVQALVRLTELADDKKLIPVDKYLSDLAGILADDSVEISQYDLRRVYSITGKIQGEESLVSAAEKLQRLIFSRRVKDLGHDMSMALPLTRLISLWTATGNLAEGQAFCEAVLNGVTKQFAEKHIIARQVKSVYDRVSRMNDSQSVLKIGELQSKAAQQATEITLGSMVYEEPEEFVSMLAIVAMDHQQSGRGEQAGLVLQEALAYYLECSSDIARRVGEMLWLLIETDLINLKNFRHRLIELSIPKAFDNYLRRQFVRNFGRMLKLLSDTETAEAIALASQVSLRLGTITAEHEPLASSPFWYQLLSQGARDEAFDEERLVKELEQLTAKHESEDRRELSKLELSRANYIGDKLSDHYLNVEKPEKAREVITGLLNIGNQTKTDVTKLLTRLARVHIAEDNICDAIAILYMAFSDLPDPYDESGPDEEPLILKP